MKKLLLILCCFIYLPASIVETAEARPHETGRKTKKTQVVESKPADQSPKAGNLRYTITVSKFKNLANWEGQFDLAQTFGAILTDSLQKSGKFVVLGENDMRNESMLEQDFAASSRVVKGRKTPVIGQMTPAQLLVKGQITHYQRSTTGGGAGLNIGGFRVGAKTDGADINAVIYIVDSATGRVIASKTVTGHASRTGLDVGFSDIDWGVDLDGFKKTNVGEAVQDAIDETVEFLTAQVEDIPWIGTVALVKEDKVYINRGAREGVKPGQNFLVGRSEVIRDPDTGEVLDEARENIGTLVAETVKEKLTICKVTHSTDKITPRMTVVQN